MARKKQKHPEEIARDAVNVWTENILSRFHGLDHGSVFQTVNLWAAAEDVEKALRAEYKGARQDSDLMLLVSREAGYLIGVQVGLRLAGGAR